MLMPSSPPTFVQAGLDRDVTGAVRRWWMSLGACLSARGGALQIHRAWPSHGWAQQPAAQPVTVPIGSLDQAVMIADASGRLVAVNPAFTTLTGYAAHEVRGRNPRLLKSARQDQAFYADLWQRLLRDGVWQGEIWNRRKDGGEFPAWQTISVERRGDGSIVRFISVFSDISALKGAEARLEYLAHHDTLTGLPNRLLFASEFERSLSRAQRHRHRLALLFIDLDDFKSVNDTLGHGAGDELLRTVAARLREAVRAEDAVARLGGDEFVVVLEEIADGAAAHEAAHKLHQAVERPLLLDAQAVCISASIGIALYPDDGTDAQTLVRAADAAMYRAKPAARMRARLLGGASER